MKKRNTKPTASKLSVLGQLCNLIPPHLVSKLARETGVDSMARSFSAWSHVVSMLFAQPTHAVGLNDVCDALGLYSGPLSALRGATAPSRNNLSHANKCRDAALAERLFWSELEHLQKLSPGFAVGRRGKGLARRFRRVIHVVDSSTIALIAFCIDWAKHRRRKAAANYMCVWTCTLAELSCNFWEEELFSSGTGPRYFPAPWYISDKYESC